MKNNVMQVANGIAAKLSHFTFGDTQMLVPVEVTPEVEFATLKQRKCVVIPASIARTARSRSDTDINVKVAVCYAEPARTEAVPELIAQMECIASTLERYQLMDETGQVFAVVTDIEQEPVYDVNILYSNQVFYSVIYVTAKVVQ